MIFGLAIAALPIMLLWQQGNAMVEKEIEIATLKAQAKDKGDSIVDLENTVSQQRAVIATLGSPGDMVDLPAGLFICTAYEASTVSCGCFADGITSEGVPVGLGVAAADHRLLPPGTILYVHDLNAYFVVLDKGGAIKGKRLDLFTIDVKSARKFGVLKSKVSIVRKG